MSTTLIICPLSDTKNRYKLLYIASRLSSWPVEMKTLNYVTCRFQEILRKMPTQFSSTGIQALFAPDIQNCTMWKI